jgi:tetratricopeptide (TPR) repeat protein
VAFVAAVILCLDNNLPLFPQDRTRAAEALAQHPRLADGLPHLDPPTLRALAARLAELRPELALRIADFLVDQPGSTPQDTVLRLYAGQNSGNWEAVSGISEELANVVTEEGQEALLLVRQHIAEDRPEAALELMEGYLARHPEDPAALRVLSDLATAHLGTLSDDLKIRLAEAFRRHPGAIPGPYLEATRLLMEVQPDKREALLQAAMARLAPAHRPVLARWLLGIGEPARVLELIPEAEALSDEPLFFLRLNALLDSGQSEAALGLLDRADPLLPAWQLDLERANIHLIRNDPVACRELLHTLPHRLPPESRNALFAIGRNAQAIGDTALMRQVYDAAFAHGLVFPVPHSMAYLSQLLEAADFEQALDFTAYCRNIRPDNPYYINNHTYLKLVGGRWSPKCIADMEAVVEAHPEVTEFRLSYALSLMLGGYAGRAMEALAPIGSDNIPYEPRSRMAYALVLAGTGAQEEATPLIRSIDLDRMMAPEQVLVDRYLRDGRF